MKSKFLRDILANAKKASKIVTMYAYDIGQEYWTVGSVGEIIDGKVRINAVNMYGEKDGFIIIRLEDIKSVSVDGIYEKKIELLMTKHDCNPFNPIALDKRIEKCLFIDTLMQAKEKNMIIRIYDEENVEFGYGYVDSIEKEKFVISGLDRYGLRTDGLYVFDVSDIGYLHCDCKEDRSVRLLFENNPL